MSFKHIEKTLKDPPLDLQKATPKCPDHGAYCTIRKVGETYKWKCPFCQYTLPAKTKLEG